MKLSSADFRSLYDEHVAGVRQLLFFKCGANDLDDLTQKVFIKAWKNLENFRAESHVKTWLYRIAWNVCVDHYRKKQIVGDELMLPNLLAEDRGAERVEIHEALQKLQSEERDLCLLYYIEGFNIEELAGILEVAPGTIKSRLHTLRESLRHVFEVARK